MVNKPKALGTAAESAVVAWLRENGHPQAERRTLHGDADLGDITGILGLCWEVKAGRTLKLSQWLRETEVERINSQADYGILVIKPVGVGGTRVGRWYAAMYFKHWERLVRADEHILSSLQPHPPYSVLSGARINRLPEAYNMALELGAPMLIKAKGVESDWWYVVTSLDHMNSMLRHAGYGDEEVAM